MSIDNAFTKENLDACLKELGKEFRKLNGNPISRETIGKALVTLYGKNAKLPPVSRKTIDDAFVNGDFERAYNEIRENEKRAKNVLLDFDKSDQRQLKGENIDTILEQARQKRKKKGNEK